MKMETGSTSAESREYLRTDEAAARCSVSPKTIRQWIDRRILPAFKPTQRTILIRVADLDKAMQRFKVGVAL